MNAFPINAQTRAPPFPPLRSISTTEELLRRIGKTGTQTNGFMFVFLNEARKTPDPGRDNAFHPVPPSPPPFDHEKWCGPPHHQPISSTTFPTELGYKRESRSVTIIERPRRYRDFNGPWPCLWHTHRSHIQEESGRAQWSEMVIW